MVIGQPNAVALDRPVPTAASGGVLLVVTQTEETAKRIESHLRNAGHPMRTAWVADLEELEDTLRRGAPDLLLSSAGLPDTPLREVIALCAEHAPDLPVLALAARLSPEDTVAALAAGARDLVSDEDRRSLRHLELVCLREFVNHRHLRELRNTRRRMADFESRHRQLLAGTADAVVHIQEGIVSQMNPAFARLLGSSEAERLVGTPLMDIIAPEQQAKVKEHLRQLNKGKVDGKPLETCLQRLDGGKVPVSAQLTRGTVDAENFIEMLIRAEAAPATPQNLDRLALFRALAMPAVERQPRAVLLFVVDAFASLEDRLGLEDAEVVLGQVAAAIKGRLGAQHVFRFSTSEFAALVSRNTAAEIERLAELLCKELSAQIFTAQQHEAQVTLTVCAYPMADGEPAAQVMAELVRQGRKLSAAGGHRWIVLGPTAQANAEEREEARRAAQLRKAIEEDRLKLAYQSIASLEGDTRQHFDVLVRMLDESGRELHAAEFIKAAERFGLMRAIDRWVVSRALAMLAKREAGGDSSSLFLKLSEDTLREAEGFLAWLQEQLKARPITHQEVCFQIPELAAQNHIRKARQLSQALRELDAGVAIEHFGVGTHSAQLLEHIPATFLKFHSSYTRNFGDRQIQKKMSMLMEIAKQRGIKTIVSHVEDANSMARMWQMGINYIQGYHVQEPEVVLLAADPVR